VSLCKTGQSRPLDFRPLLRCAPPPWLTRLLQLDRDLGPLVGQLQERRPQFRVFDAGRQVHALAGIGATFFWITGHRDEQSCELGFPYPSAGFIGRCHRRKCLRGSLRPFRFVVSANDVAVPSGLARYEHHAEGWDVLGHGASRVLIGPIGPWATVDHGRTFPQGAHGPKVRCPGDPGVAALS
jgi:hypothetical protein